MWHGARWLARSIGVIAEGDSEDGSSGGAAVVSLEGGWTPGAGIAAAASAVANALGAAAHSKRRSKIPPLLYMADFFFFTKTFQKFYRLTRF